MSDNDWKKRLGVVFSTQENFDYSADEHQHMETLPNKEQHLKVLLDKKQRKGKQVSLITGFQGSDDNMKNLAKLLKTKCGTGGSVKDGEIVIQGDFRNKIAEILLAEGYNVKKVGG